MAAVRVCRNRYPRAVVVRHGGRILRSQLSRPPPPADGGGTQYPCQRFTLTRRTILANRLCADGTKTTTLPVTSVEPCTSDKNDVNGV